MSELNKDFFYNIVYEEEETAADNSKSTLLLPAKLPSKTETSVNTETTKEKHPFAPRIPGLSDEDFFVAVYGSLKRGFGNSHRLLQTKLEFEGFVKGGFDMFSFGSYPALHLNEEAKFNIHVEVYSPTKEVLKSLDILEGYPNFYTRELVWVRPYKNPNDLYSCWIYFIKDNYASIRKKVTDVNEFGSICWTK